MLKKTPKRSTTTQIGIHELAHVRGGEEGQQHACCHAEKEAAGTRATCTTGSMTVTVPFLGEITVPVPHCGG